MPVAVWKKVVAIQRKFLWGGAVEKVKIAWVKWSEVCRSKEGGGLGIKNLRLMNLALLMKWRWRLLTSQETLWSQVLEVKYGKDISVMQDLSRFVNSKHASNWWKDLCRLGLGLSGDDRDWCVEVVSKKLGNGGITRFWSEAWIGSRLLCQVFPRLFLISEQKSECISCCGEWRNDVWVWKFKWHRRLLIWEEELLVQLMGMLGNAMLARGVDEWVCEIGLEGRYAVSCGYQFLCNNFSLSVASNTPSKLILSQIWRSYAPLKVRIFSWQLVLQRLPTRSNLNNRGVILTHPQMLCVWCSVEVENEEHLFTRCGLAVGVWTAINSWLGLQSVVPGSITQSLQAFGYPFKSKKRAAGLVMIWKTVMWSLWLARNRFIFEDKLLQVSEIVDASKHRIWQWFIASKFGGVCLQYEWNHLPLDCLLR